MFRVFTLFLIFFSLTPRYGSGTPEITTKTGNLNKSVVHTVLTIGQKENNSGTSHSVPLPSNKTATQLGTEQLESLKPTKKSRELGRKAIQSETEKPDKGVTNKENLSGALPSDNAIGTDLLTNEKVEPYQDPKVNEETATVEKKVENTENGKDSTDNKDLAGPSVPVTSDRATSPKVLSIVLWSKEKFGSMKGKKLNDAEFAHLINTGDPTMIFRDLIKLSGQGAGGQVSTAIDKRNEEVIIIKKIVVTDDNLRQVVIEITVLELCKHKNLVSCLGVYVQIQHKRREQTAWLVMEYMNGGNLGNVVKKYNLANGGMDEEQIATILLNLLEGVNCLHQQGIFHRDIKSDNILLSYKDGSAKLADYGSAGNSSEETNEQIGTPYWMAPELIGGENYTTNVDIWSVGIVAVELVVGIPPYFHLGPMPALHAIVNSKSPQLTTTNASEMLKSFVSQCVKKDPTQRPSADQLLKHEFLRTASANTAIIKNLIDPPKPRRQEPQNSKTVKGTPGIQGHPHRDKLQKK